MALMPRARAKLRGLALAALVGACAPPPAELTTTAPAPAPEVAAPPAPTCAPTPVEALAYLADETCPWALVPGQGPELSLRRTDAAAPLVLQVAPPEGCAGRCSYSGVKTALGPLLLAVRADLNSELVDAAFVGAALGGRTLRFAPLWYGRAALGDSTPQGPTHGLAPWICGDMLVFVARPRLPGAAGEEPSSALQAAAGVYELMEDELRRVDRPVPKDLNQCIRVPLELP